MGKNIFFFPIFFFIFENKWFRKIYQRNPDIVIEGYGGSANSFAVYAFESAQKRKFKIAHHLHITAQIKKSASSMKPVIIIIRRPKDAVRSLISRGYYPCAKLAFKHYYNFYSDIIKFKDNFIIVTFEQLIDDPNIMVDKLNKKFSIQFIKNNKMNETAIQLLINESKGINSAIPSKDRIQKKELSDTLISKITNSKWFNLSENIYQDFIR